jgi:hypothetical protein
MDAQWAREFRERWQAVAAAEAEEQRTASLDTRWQQMNAILGLAIALRLPIAEADRQEETVRQRWAKLKSLLT